MLEHSTQSDLTGLSQVTHATVFFPSLAGGDSPGFRRHNFRQLLIFNKGNVLGVQRFSQLMSVSWLENPPLRYLAICFEALKK